LAALIFFKERSIQSILNANRKLANFAFLVRKIYRLTATGLLYGVTLEQLSFEIVRPYELKIFHLRTTA